MEPDMFADGEGAAPTAGQGAYPSLGPDISDRGPADHLWMSQGEDVWDLGPADLDTDADGIADSLTRTGPDGMAVYTDSDADGRVDLITEIGADGSFSAQRLDTGTGTWRPTDSGRLA